MSRELPDPEEILALAAGELPEDQAQSLRQRIVDDPKVARFARALVAFPASEAPEEHPDLTADELAEDWQAIEQRLPRDYRLDGPEPASTPPLEFPTRTPASLRRRGAERLAIAATLFAVVGGTWGLTQWNGARQAREPKILQPVHLLADEPHRSTAIPPTAHTLPETSTGYVLTLSLIENPGASSYRLRLFSTSGGGTAIWQEDGLTLGPDDSLTLQLHRNFLKPGEYTLHLDGKKGQKMTPMGVFSIRIPSPPH